MYRLLTLSLFFLCLLGTDILIAQNCGLRPKDAYDLREQMFQNRNRIPVETVAQFQAQRLNFYIPLVIHLVGDSLGRGYVNPEGVLGMVCRLNDDFADQNIQFYIKDSLRYFSNQTVYNDAYDSVAIDEMTAAKDSTAANIFINNNAGGGVAGYYSRRGDFIFILRPYATYGSTTITHEFGHFFTLPHTFYGWEGINAPGLYFNTPAPDSVDNGHDELIEVEYVARTGPLANCYSSADGFCDTEADYHSDRIPCPYNYNVLDPSGTVIAPDQTLFMSYFYDACTDSFSNEQKVAIMSDLINRNWLGFPQQNPIVMDGISLSALQPSPDSVISPIGDSIRLEWDTVGASAATDWVLTIERIYNGIPVQTALQTIVTGQTYFDVDLSYFGDNRSYRWKVRPYSNSYTCANSSDFFFFDIGTLPTDLELTENSSFDIKVFPNPVRQGMLQFNVQNEILTTAAVRIYSADGRLVFSTQQELALGLDRYQLDVSMLSAGVYQLLITTKHQSKTKTFSIIK